MHSPHNHPDIKIGEIYNLRIHVIGKSEDFIIARPITQNGGYSTSSFLEILHKYAPSFTPIPSKHGTSVPTPKHDPCRLFKKGDKVRVKNTNGRHYNSWSKKVENQIFVVAGDEIEHANVYLDVGGNRSYGVDPAYLELVTPVEELEPYSVKDDGGFYYIEKQDELHALCTFNKNTHPNAKAAAEAECDRLNAEWRKEQNHD